MHLRYLPPRILQTTIWVPTRLLLKYCTKIRIQGKERLSGVPRGVIFASNHLSEMDPILIPATLTPLSPHFPLFYVARDRKFYTTSGWRQRIYGGYFFAAWGAYPAYAGKCNYEQSLPHHIKILQNKRSLQIFPEGRKSRDGSISDEVHGGVAYLAWRTNTPVVPVAIKGTFKTTVKDFLLRRKRYAIAYGAPMYPNQLFKNMEKQPTVDEFKTAARKIMNEVKKLYNTL